MKNFLFSTLIVFTFVLAAGCGGGGGEDKDTAVQDAVTDTGTDTTPADTTPTDTAPTDTTPADTAKDTTPTDTTPADTAKDTTPTDTTPADTGKDTTVVMGTFKGTIIDFQTKAPVEGATITVMDNETGKETTTVVTSKAGGAVEIQLPKGTLVGFKNFKEGSKNTYQFNMNSEGQTETLWLVSELTYTVAPQLAGLTVDTSKGIVAGGLYWINPTTSDEEPIGCAVIKSDPQGDIRYFADNGLPAPLTSAPSVNKKNGYFLAANVPVGTTTITAYEKDGSTNVLGSVKIFTFKDSICISNINITTGTKNPTTCP
jgi:hypothetical protein